MDSNNRALFFVLGYNILYLYDMITVSATTDKIEALLDGSSTQVELVLIGRLFTENGMTTITNLNDSNGTTPVSISGSPSVNQKIFVDFISAFNNDSTSKELTLRYNNSSSTYILFKVSLAAGEKLEYNSGTGWTVYATNGAVKNSINQGANAPTSNAISSVVLGGDITNNNAVANTMNDVTGLEFVCEASKTYWFKFVIPFTSAATTTGSRWGLTATAGTAANLSYTSEYSLTSTTTTRNANVQAFDSPASCNATSANTGNNLCVMEGYFKPTADCTLKARFASEIANSAITAKAGAIVYYQKTN
ncbi:MAG: hypothetical protein EKK64_07890 [Neisseriaceae bacterium]|nr:MAG: hypothetical protein EKK64_07890 [Neisseriaceae bacterium]